MRVIYNKDPYVKGQAKDLIESPVVIRVGEISETSAKEFSLSMTDAYNTGQPVIPVVIDSYGGDAYALLSMLSDIETCRLPVSTICVGKAMSAASVLLAHGSPGLRHMDPNATVMLHEVSSIMMGKTSEMQAAMSEVDRLNQIIFQKMAFACKQKDRHYFLKIIAKQKNADLFFDVRDCKKHKIIDNIGIPEFHVNIQSNIQFAFAKPIIK
jgi:ATP-dependent Clp protease protease subunit